MTVLTIVGAVIAATIAVILILAAMKPDTFVVQRSTLINAPANKIYIRFADVLLWKAEAYNETGSYPQAIAIINKVRQRARNTITVDGTAAPAGTLPDRNTASVDKAQIKTWLMHERRVELGFESQRFNDLKRWGIAKQVLTALGKNFQDRNMLYPIPQGEIDKSGGSITQNPGY